MKKHRWFWISLFVLAVALLATLATMWNIDTVFNPRFTDTPWIKIVFGSLGFLAAVATIILFFVRLLMEMRLNLMQTEFLARVSHELKSPITSLELSGSLLRDLTPSTKESNKLWTIFDSELTRLKTEVDLILETSRWEVKPGKLNMSTIDLGIWVDDAIVQWRAILGSKAELKHTGDLRGVKTLTDPHLLKLITNNIVDNVRKFARDTPRLSIECRILEGKSSTPYWQLRFIDDGWGFKKGHKKKLFKRFYRADTGALHAIAGTGLGLYLASAASRSLGIKIRGESDGPGCGARFTLEGRLK